MRILKFIVESSTIMQDPSCNFDGLFPAPNQRITAEFIFSDNWTGVPKVAAFYSMLGAEYPPQIIDEENRCMIPPEALNSPAFRIQILGSNRRTIMSTNKLTVYQKGGKV